MKVKFFLTTVGEDVTLRTLECLKAYTPFEPDLTIWYDACGRGVDWEFYKTLCTYTNDVILVRENKYISSAWNFAALSLDCDYLVILLADSPPKPFYWTKMMEPFSDHTVGVSGEMWYPQLENKTVYNDRIVDGIACWNKKAIEYVGAFSPSFRGFGHMHNELQMRMEARGWKFAAMNGLCEEGNLKHEGRDLNKNVTQLIHEDDLAWLDAKGQKFKQYEWWTRKLGKETVNVA